MFGLLISKLRKFLLKLRVDHLGKFAPREIDLLYGMCCWGELPIEGQQFLLACLIHHPLYDRKPLKCKPTLHQTCEWFIKC